MAIADTWDDDDIDLEEPRPAGMPGVKFNAIGDTLVGMLVHVDDSQPREKYGRPGEFHRKPDGSVQTKTVLTYLVMPGTKGVTVKDWDDETGRPKEDAQGRKLHREVQPGEFVVRYLEGAKRWDYFQAKKSIGSHKLGDVIRERFTEESWKGRNGEQLQQAKKIHTFEMRRAKAEEAGLKAQCKAQYLLIRDSQRAPKAVAPVAPVIDDLEDF